MHKFEKNLFARGVRAVALGLAVTFGGSCVGEVKTIVPPGKEVSRLNDESKLETKPKDGSFAETIHNLAAAKEDLGALRENWQAVQERRRRALK